MVHFPQSSAYFGTVEENALGNLSVTKKESPYKDRE